MHPLEVQSKALLIIAAAQCGADSKQEPGLGAAICQGEAAEMKKEEVFNLGLETQGENEFSKFTKKKKKFKKERVRRKNKILFKIIDST